jgi:aspartate aminotransferase
MVVEQRQIDRMLANVAHIQEWILHGPWARNHLRPGIADFAFGNPQEMPLPGLIDALERGLQPRDKDWFAYKVSEPPSQKIVAKSLRRRTGIGYLASDIAMTAGAFGALAVTMRATVDAGDEVIFLSPPWFFYELMVIAAGATPVRVRLAPPAFDLDADAVAAAITPRTRAIIVNSPSNPSGRVYGPAELSRLGAVLQAASQRIGRPILLVSDESYNRIVFDGRAYRSPAEFYPATITIYTYGKTLLAPGQRIGYLALSPTLPDREALRPRIMVAQIAAGWGFPNALLQHALGDLEALSVDVGALQARRDRLVPALLEMGYEATLPEGTFYVMVRCPVADDMAFTERLAELGALVLPGTIVECPGWFRISLTASDEMVERGLDVFRTALGEAG